MGNLHIRVHFVVMDSLALPLVIGKSFIDMFFKRIFQIERHIVPIRSHLVATILEHTPPPDPLTVLRKDADAESTSDYQ